MKNESRRRLEHCIHDHEQPLGSEAAQDIERSASALRAEVRRLRADRATAFRLVSQMPGHALRQDVLAVLAPRKTRGTRK